MWLLNHLYCFYAVEGGTSISHSTQWLSCEETQLEVTQGTAHALSSTTPTLTSWLTQIQRAARAQHRQTGISLRFGVCRLQACGRTLQGCAPQL